MRAIVEHIEDAEDEIKDLTEARKRSIRKSKGNGFDVKILREIPSMTPVTLTRHASCKILGAA